MKAYCINLNGTDGGVYRAWLLVCEKTGEPVFPDEQPHNLSHLTAHAPDENRTNAETSGE